MKIDANPSVLFLSYSTPEAFEKLKMALEVEGLNMREIRLFDVEMPLDDLFDERINFFKHFVNNEYWSDRVPKLDSVFLKPILNKLPFKPINFKRGQWQNDNKHRLLWSLCVPIAYQDTGTRTWLTTEQEKANYEKLKTFDSDGYKPVISGLYNDDGTPSKDVK